MQTLQPKEWKRPSGYSNGIKVQGEMIFVAGQVGWNKNSEIVSENLVDQVRQALENIVTVLEVAEAKPEQIVRMTWYLIDLKEYRSLSKEIGFVYREVIGKHYPVMSLFQVSDLLEEGAKVEIEATAVKTTDNDQ